MGRVLCYYIDVNIHANAFPGNSSDHRRKYMYTDPLSQLLRLKTLLKTFKGWGVLNFGLNITNFIQHLCDNIYMGQHVFLSTKTSKEADVMIRMTKEHEGKSRVPPNGNVHTAATGMWWMLSRTFNANDENHCSVAGMTNPSLGALPTPSGHATDQTANGSLIDIVPFLHQGLC